MKSALTTTLVLGLTAVCLHAQAVPGLISYQGRIVDGTGTGLGTGTPLNRKILFRLFDAGTGGTRLWSEEQTVTISNGDFSVILGQGVSASYNGSPENPKPSLLTVFSGTDRYLEMVVDNGDGAFNATDTPIAPRQRLISTAYAVRASVADGIASGSDFSLKDANYGLGWYGTGRTFGGVAVDGPVLYGFGGGALGSVSGTTQTTALRWNSLGNIGIGTAAPTEKLDLVGNAKISGTVTAAGVSSSTSITAATSVSAHGSNGFVFNTVGDTDGGMFSPADGVVTFKTNGTERARIDSSGNLGIANISPTEKLDVTGNIKASGSVTAVGSVISTTALTAKAGINFGTNGLGANSTEGGSNGNFIAFGTNNFSEDFLGYASNTFYFKDSPLGGDATEPSIVVGGGITTGGAIFAHTGGIAAPSLSATGGSGTRISFWPGSGTETPYALGVDGSTLWSSVPSSAVFKWYSGTSQKMSLNGSTGDLAASGNVTANGKTAAVGEENLRIIRGTIAGNGTITRGSGFTVTGSGGNWTINFATAFSGIPSVTVNPSDSGNQDICMVASAATTSVIIRMRNAANGDTTSWPFCFIAIGPR